MRLDVDWIGIGSSKIQFSVMAHHYGWEGDCLQLYILMMVNGGDTIPSSWFYHYFPRLDYYLEKEMHFYHYVSDIFNPSQWSIQSETINLL